MVDADYNDLGFSVGGRLVILTQICGAGNAFISVSLNETYYLGSVSSLRGL